MNAIITWLYKDTKHVGLEQVITWAAMYLFSGMVVILYVIERDNLLVFPLLWNILTGLMMWISGIASSRQREEEKKHPPIVMTESQPLFISQNQYPFNPNSFYPTDGYGSEKPDDAKEDRGH